MSWVFDSSESLFADRLIFLSIANHCDRYGTDAWPLQETIAAEAKVSTREVIRAIQSLVKLGELRVEKGKGKIGRNRYTIIGMEPASNAQRLSDQLSLRESDSYVTSTAILSDKYDIPKCQVAHRNKEELSITIQNQPSKTIAYPEWLPRDLFDQFIQERKAMKKPMTLNAVNLAIGRLAKFRAEGQDIVTIIENSIVNGWQGFFPISAPKQPAVFAPRNFKQEAQDKWQNEFMTKRHGADWREKVANGKSN